MRVEVYGKPQCPLCDEAMQVLEEIRAEIPFDLVHEDVTRVPDLERYASEVPVVLVAGQRAFHGKLDPAAVRARIAEAMAADRRAAPMRRRLLLAALAIGAAMAALLLAGVWGSTSGQERRLARAQERAFGVERLDLAAPDFEQPTATGGTFSLAKHRGEVLFVNFWATWCPPCRDELPSMLKLGRELAARHPGKFRMVGISVDEGFEVVREFFGGAPPPELTVTLDADQSATKAYYCSARGACPESYKFPETYIVDRNGRLVAYVVGPRDWSDPAALKLLEGIIGG